jgi:Spy/CpxP family protein refolding chaperone
MMGQPGGMMGGYGMGGDMMGPGMRALSGLDLNDSQRAQVSKIQDDIRHKNWDLMGKSQDEMAKLRDAYLASGKLDRKAILDSYKRIDELRLQRINNSLDAVEKIEDVLTPQQREQLKRRSPLWAAELGQ